MLKTENNELPLATQKNALKESTAATAFTENVEYAALILLKD